MRNPSPFLTGNTATSSSSSAASLFASGEERQSSTSHVSSVRSNANAHSTVPPPQQHHDRPSASSPYSSSSSRNSPSPRSHPYVRPRPLPRPPKRGHAITSSSMTTTTTATTTTPLTTTPTKPPSSSTTPSLETRTISPASRSGQHRYKLPPSREKRSVKSKSPLTMHSPQSSTSSPLLAPRQVTSTPPLAASGGLYSEWAQPLAQRPTIELALEDGWQQAMDPSGRIYYFHSQSGETSWDRPTKATQAPQQNEQQPHSLAVAEHVMDQASEQSPAGTPPSLYPGSTLRESNVEVENKPAVVESEKPVGASSEKQDAAVVERKENRSPESALDELPSGWVELKDPSGRFYFYNAQIGETTWERPRMANPTEEAEFSSMPEEHDMSVKREAVKREDDSSDAVQDVSPKESAADPGTASALMKTKSDEITPSTGTDSALGMAADCLPYGWSEAQDPTSGRTYFYNSETGQTSWERPTSESVKNEDEADDSIAPPHGRTVTDNKQSVDADQPSINNSAPADEGASPLEIDATSGQEQKFNLPQSELAPDAGDRPNEDTQKTGLPAGWVEALDPVHGQTYYYNSETGETSWQHPDRTTRQESTSSEGPTVEVTRHFDHVSTGSSSAVAGIPPAVEQSTPSTDALVEQLAKNELTYTEEHTEVPLEDSKSATDESNEKINPGLETTAESLGISGSGEEQSTDAANIADKLDESGEENPLLTAISPASREAHKGVGPERATTVPSTSPMEHESSEHDYENKADGVSSIDKVESDAITSSLPAGWTEGFDSAQGRAYYFNVETGESSWERPLGINDGQEEGENFSADQDKAEDQGITDTTETFDEMTMIGNKDDATFPSVPEQTGGSLPLPPGWTEVIEPLEGRSYFYNSETGETSWERPVLAPGYDQRQEQGPKLQNETISCMDCAAENTVTADAPTTIETSKETKPLDNEAEVEPIDKTGFRGKEGEANQSDAKDKEDHFDDDEDDAVKQLPLGWVSATDPISGQHYFFCTETGETSWDPPAILSANGVTPRGHVDGAGSGDGRQQPERDADERTGIPDQDTDNETAKTPLKQSQEGEVLPSIWTDGRRPTEETGGTNKGTMLDREETEIEAEKESPAFGPVVALEAQVAEECYAPEETNENPQNFDSMEGMAYAENISDPAFDKLGETLVDADTTDAVDPSRPEEHAGEEDKTVLPDAWVTAIDPALGRAYYYNAETGETSWDPPILQPTLPPDEKASFETDDGIIVTAPSEVGEENLPEKGSSDAVDIDMSRSNASSLQATGSGQKSDMDDQPMPEEVTKEDDGVGLSSAMLPDGWATSSDPSSGRVFYYNVETGETSWDPPTQPPESTSPQGEEMEFPGEATTIQGSIALGGATVLKADHLAKSEVHVEQNENPLELDALENTDLDHLGSKNDASEMTQALHDKGFPRAEEQECGQDQGAEILPSGWEISIEPTSGQIYYFNTETGETSWDPPIALTKYSAPREEVTEFMQKINGPREEETECIHEMDAFNASPAPGLLSAPPAGLAGKSEDSTKGEDCAVAMEHNVISTVTGESEEVLQQLEKPNVAEFDANMTITAEVCNEQGDGEDRTSEVLPVGWVAATDPASGRTYYFHADSGETSWDPPSLPTEARPLEEEQTNILLNEDVFEESPALGSFASPPTGDTDESKAAVEVEEDAAASREFSGNETVENTELEVFQQPEQSSVAEIEQSLHITAEANAEQGYTEDRSSGVLPVGWVAAIDPETGRTYYFNADSGETSWDSPLETVEAVASEEATAQGGDISVETQALLPEGGDISVETQALLPDTAPRVNRADKSGASDSLEENPEGKEAPVQNSPDMFESDEGCREPEQPCGPAASLGRPGKTSKNTVGANEEQGNSECLSSEMLPVGWIAAIDPASGRTYYFNEGSGETSWDPPLQTIESGPSQEEMVPALENSQALAQDAAPPTNHADESEALGKVEVHPEAKEESAQNSPDRLDSEEVLQQPKQYNVAKLEPNLQVTSEANEVEGVDRSSGVLPVGWVAATDPSSGRPYYFNADSGETSRDPPLQTVESVPPREVLPEENALKDIQALDSDAAPPTDHTYKSEAPDKVGGKSESVESSAQRYTVTLELDESCQHPDELGDPDANLGGYGETLQENLEVNEEQGEREERTSEVLSAGWVAATDPASGRTYYFHEDSGETSWDPPLQARPLEDEHTNIVVGKDALENDRSLASFASRPTGDTDESKAVVDAEDGDAKAKELSGNGIFENTESEEVVQQPEEDRVTEHDANLHITSEAKADEENREDRTSKVLPVGWVAATDPASGRTYYFNADSGETSWDLPLQPPIGDTDSSDASEPPVMAKDSRPSGPLTTLESQQTNVAESGQHVFREVCPAVKITAQPPETERGPKSDVHGNGQTSWDKSATTIHGEADLPEILQNASLATPESDWGESTYKDSNFLTAPTDVADAATGPVASDGLSDKALDLSESSEKEAIPEMTTEGDGRQGEDTGTELREGDRLPVGWEEAYDPTSGKTYYFNENSGETSWDRPGPDKFDASQDKPVPKEGRATETEVEDNPESDLPLGWEEVPDSRSLAAGAIDSGHVNATDIALNLDQSANGGNSDESASLRDNPASADSTSVNEASPWEETVDPTSNGIFYFNKETGETRWDRPSCLGPTKLTPEAYDGRSSDQSKLRHEADTEGWEVVGRFTSSVPVKEASVVEGGIPGHLVTTRNDERAKKPGRPLHAVAHISFGGNLCKYDGQGSIVIQPIHESLLRDALVDTARERRSCGIAGPLHKADDQNVKAFMGKMESMTKTDMLWRLISIAAQSKGRLRSLNGVSDPNSPETAVVQLLLEDENILSSGRRHRTCHSDTEQDKADISSVEQLLVRGKREEAVECALREHQYGLALLVAGMCGRDTYQRAAERFCNNALAEGSPLHTIAVMFSSPSQVGVSSHTLFGDTPSELQSSWKSHLAAIINNRIPGWESAVLALGDRLRQVGLTEAAHFCFMVCGTPISSPIREGCRWTLVGCNVAPSDVVLSTDGAVESFLRTEAYEWAKRQGNPYATIRTLQAFKAIYAVRLVEYGFVEDAYLYVASALECLGESSYDDIVAAETKKPLGLAILSTEKKSLVGALNILRTRLDQLRKGGTKNHIISFSGRREAETESHKQDATLSVPPIIPSQKSKQAAVTVARLRNARRGQNNIQGMPANPELKRRVPIEAAKAAEATVQSAPGEKPGTSKDAPSMSTKGSGTPIPEQSYVPKKSGLRPPTSERPPSTVVNSVADPPVPKAPLSSPVFPGTSMAGLPRTSGIAPPSTIGVARPDKDLSGDIDPNSMAGGRSKDAAIPDPKSAPSGLETPSRGGGQVPRAPSSAPADLRQMKSESPKSNSKTRGWFNFGIKEYFISKLHPNAKIGVLGGELKAQFVNGRWVFPGDDPNEVPASAGPPPTTPIAAKSENPEPVAAKDPLSMMMAPPPVRRPAGRRVQSSAASTKSTLDKPTSGTASASASKPPATPQFAVFKPPPST
ncbi:hypothetical protein ACA910_022522 [Epithemia clementina (nom. ined.)]